MKQLLASDLPIFPCRNKKPIREGWQTIKWETKDWIGITEIGLQTGKISGMAVIDADGPKGIQSCIERGWTSPYFCYTSDGRHYYFKWREGINNSQNLDGQRAGAGGDGVDVRGEGGYVLIPPSKHPITSSLYRWAGQRFPQVINLPPFPNLGQEIRAVSEKPVNIAHVDRLSESLDGLTEGQRRPKLLSIIGSLYNSYSAEAIEKLLTPLVEKINLPVEELRRLIRATKGWERHGQIQQEDTEEIKIKTIENWIDKDPDNKIEFISGFQKLDSLLRTFKRQHIFTIAARTGLGKTAILGQMANSLQRSDKRVLYFSTEMTEDDMRKRGALFPICDYESPSVEKIDRALLIFEPEIFIFDHFNVVGTDSHQLAAFMRGLKTLTRKYNIACLLAAQFNRMADVVNPMTGKKVRPRLSHIQGSSAVEQFSAQVLLLDEKQKHDNGVFFTGYLDKNRFGRLGQVEFSMNYEPFKIEEL